MNPSHLLAAKLGSGKYLYLYLFVRSIYSPDQNSRNKNFLVLIIHRLKKKNSGILNKKTMFYFT